MRPGGKSDPRLEIDADWRPDTYWPTANDVEVVIASLWLSSGPGNEIRLMASPGIAFRAEDAYGYKLSLEPSRSVVPLSNSELMQAVKTLEWREGPTPMPVWSLREQTAEYADLASAARFISGESSLYPAFQAMVEQDNRAFELQSELAGLRLGAEQLRAVLVDGQPAPELQWTESISLRALERARLEPPLRELLVDPSRGDADLEQLSKRLATRYPLEVGLWALVTGRAAQAGQLLGELASSSSEQRWEATEGLAMLALAEENYQLARKLWHEM
jgi:hypothetical protein